MAEINADAIVNELIEGLETETITITEVLNEIDKKVNSDPDMAQALLDGIVGQLALDSEEEDNTDIKTNILFQYVQARINGTKIRAEECDSTKGLIRQIMNNGHAILDSESLEKTTTKKEQKARKRINGQTAYPIFKCGYKMTQHPTFLFYMGVAANNCGDKAEAIRCFEEYMQQDGGKRFVLANRYLTNLYADKENINRSLAVVSHFPNIFDSAKPEETASNKKYRAQKPIKNPQSIDLLIPRYIIIKNQLAPEHYKDPEEIMRKFGEKGYAEQLAFVQSLAATGDIHMTTILCNHMRDTTAAHNPKRTKAVNAVIGSLPQPPKIKVKTPQTS